MTNKDYEILTDVIFRLDYPSLEKYDASKLKEFQKLIRNKFPVLQEIQYPPMFEFNLEGQQLGARTSDIPKWNFFSKDKAKIVGIDKSNVTLEHKKYLSSKEFFEEVDLILGGLFDLFPDIISTRVGLRFISEINIMDSSDPLDWSKYIDDSLIKSIELFRPKFKIVKHICSIEISEEEYSLRFQFGMPNSLYPNPITKKEFVLDYDCYTKESLDKLEILGKVKLFKEVIKSTSERTIKGDLKQSMEVL